MRRISAHIEALGSTHFVLLIGLVAGAIQGLPDLLLSAGSTAPRIVSFIIFGSAAILWWTAALFLWWIAVRRQRSIWLTAAQLTLGLVVAETFAASLRTVGAPIDPQAPFAISFSQRLQTVLNSSSLFGLFRSPLWFFGSALAIALGRHLNVGQLPPPSASTSAATHPAAVT